MQETVEIETPLTHKKIVLRGYITGRQDQEINAAIINASRWDTSGGDAVPRNVSGEAVFAAENKAIGIVVLSVDGSTENVAEQVLDLPSQDFDYVKQEVEKVVSPLSKKKSTTSSQDTTDS